MITREDFELIRYEDYETQTVAEELIRRLLKERDAALAMLEETQGFLRFSQETVSAVERSLEEAEAKAEVYRKTIDKVRGYGPLILAVDKDFIDTEAQRIRSKRKRKDKL